MRWFGASRAGDAADRFWYVTPDGAGGVWRAAALTGCLRPTPRPGNGLDQNILF